MTSWKTLFGTAAGIAVLIVVTPAAAQVFSASQDLRNTVITNTTGYDLGAIDIDAKDGTVIGTVYMSKSMTFGADQRPIKGSGSIAGRGGSAVSVVILPTGKHAPNDSPVGAVQLRALNATLQGTTPMLGNAPFAKGDIPDLATGDMPDGSLVLKVGLIAWNDDGSTDRVRNLQPAIACSNGKQVKIISDLENPTVKGGLLSIDTESGKLSLKIKYGSYGTAQGSMDALCGAAMPNSSSPDRPTANAGTATAATRKEAQQRLRSLAYDPGIADGAIGAKTIAALKKFQSDHGLSATGMLDQKTLDALGVASPSAPPSQQKLNSAVPAPSERATPEEYHIVDPAKAGFKLVLQMKSMTMNAMGSVTDGDVSAVQIDDQPSPSVKGNWYPMELSSSQMLDGKIHTTEFGELRVASGDSSNASIQMMMTDSQIRKVQTFLNAKKK